MAAVAPPKAANVKIRFMKLSLCDETVSVNTADRDGSPEHCPMDGRPRYTTNEIPTPGGGMVGGGWWAVGGGRWAVGGAFVLPPRVLVDAPSAVTPVAERRLTTQCADGHEPTGSPYDGNQCSRRCREDFTRSRA